MSRSIRFMEEFITSLLYPFSCLQQTQQLNNWRTDMNRKYNAFCQKAFSFTASEMPRFCNQDCQLWRVHTEKNCVSHNYAIMCSETADIVTLLLVPRYVLDVLTANSIKTIQKKEEQDSCGSWIGNIRALKMKNFYPLVIGRPTQRPPLTYQASTQCGEGRSCHQK